MLRTTTNRARRSGFTLVELLVMSAVCVLIMAVLASVFGSGLDAIRHVRAQGDMMDQLRAASDVMKRDLRNQGFLSDPQPGRGERTRLSEYRFDIGGEPAPRGGYFQIYSPTSRYEGSDADGLWCTSATNHSLQFTSVASGNADSNHYSVTVGGFTYTSPAIEVGYFLVADPGRKTGGTTVNANTLPQDTYLLIRRYRLVAVNTTHQTYLRGALAAEPGPSSPTQARADQVISTPVYPPGALPGTATVNLLSDLVTGNRMSLNQLNGPRYGDDILLSNVLSFEVKVLTNTPGAFSGGDTDHPYLNLGAAVHDTGAAPTFRTRSLKITIRVYDSKMNQARQVTFIQDM